MPLNADGTSHFANCPKAAKAVGASERPARYAGKEGEMLADYVEATLENLNSGAVIDLFESALDSVLENIGDPSTKAETVREIRIVVKIRPNDDRTSAVTTVQVGKKLAEPAPHTSFVQLGHDGQHVHALVADVNVKQNTLPFREGKTGESHGA